MRAPAQTYDHDDGSACAICSPPDLQQENFESYITNDGQKGVVLGVMIPPHLTQSNGELPLPALSSLLLARTHHPVLAMQTRQLVTLNPLSSIKFHLGQALCFPTFLKRSRSCCHSVVLYIFATTSCSSPATTLCLAARSRQSGLFRIGQERMGVSLHTDNHSHWYNIWHSHTRGFHWPAGHFRLQCRRF